MLEPLSIGSIVEFLQQRFPEIMSTTFNSNSAAGAIGLSDPQYAARRKRMYEFLTRVRAIGCVAPLRLPRQQSWIDIVLEPT